jgi:hypothetical protein
MVALACNPSTWGVEAGGLQAQGQPGLHRILCVKKKKKEEEERREGGEERGKTIKEQGELLSHPSQISAHSYKHGSWVGWEMG